MALLTACGGSNVASDTADQQPAASGSTILRAGVSSGGPAPAPDSAAVPGGEPRNVDMLAEEYRSAAMQRQTRTGELAPGADQAPVEAPPIQ